MTYLDLIRDADRKLDNGDITLGEYEQMIEPLKREIQPEPCEDAVSREAVSEWLKQYGQDVLHGKYKFSLMYM